MRIFFEMIITYYSHLENIHNLKFVEFESFKNSKYVSKS
jgi:hypothetical protein